jgi:hypothetical protein
MIIGQKKDADIILIWKLVKKLMMTIKEFFILQKFRFDIGVSFLTILNLTLISITASKIIQDYVRIAIPIIIAILVLFALFGTWLFGYILDTKIKFMHEMNTISNQRNQQLSQILSNTKQIKKMFREKKDD